MADDGFDRAMVICAVLFAGGGPLSLLTIRAPLNVQRHRGPAEASRAGPHLHCGVGAPPLTQGSVRER